MAFRTILIEKARRINLDLNSIVVNYEDNDFNINLDEISTIIFDDPMCLISLKLISKLCERGISIIFTDYSHNPIGTLLSLNINTRASKKVKQQILWNDITKETLWVTIIKSKINNQINTLKKLKKTEKVKMLTEYVNEITYNDKTNREGIASRVYFKSLFSENFKRFEEDIINYCLNFSYQIIRSKISQEIISSGYITQIGINHKSEYNYFNLSDDFIEPYRPIVDYYVYKTLEENEETYLTPNLKRKIIDIINNEILYDNQKIKINISIQFYVQNMLNFMETGNIDKLKFPILYEK